MRRTVESDDAPRPVGPYAQAVLAGDFVFVAGQIGLDPATGKLVPGGTRAELDRVLTNLTAVLRASGHTLEDVVKTTVYLIDLGEMALVNETYAGAFSAPHPARATVQVVALPAGARVEIEAIAVRGSREPARRV
jgi:2-iminobutanoate/2-iminopropanoate deaminase